MAGYRIGMDQSAGTFDSTSAAACCIVEPCLPSPVERPLAGAGWLHEIKHDGFRMLVRRNAGGVRLFTRNGHDWTGRFPLIARAALSLKAVSCLIDGEAVACDGDGLPCSTDCATATRTGTSSFTPST